MAAGAVSSARDPRHDVRWKWLLLGLCALAAVWIISVFFDNVGLGARAWWGWQDALTLSSGQAYRSRFESVQSGGAAAKSGFRDGDWFDWREQSLETRARLLTGQPMATQATDILVHRGAHTLTVPFVGSTLFEGNARVKLLDFLPYIGSSFWFLGCALLVLLRGPSLYAARAMTLVLLFMSNPGWVFEMPSAIASLAINVVTTIALIAFAPILLVRLSSGMGRTSTLRRVLEVCAYLAIAANVGDAVAVFYSGLTLQFDPLIFGGWPFSDISSYFVFLTLPAVAIAATAATPSAERPRTAWLLLPIPLAFLLNQVGLYFASEVSNWQGAMIFYVVASLATLVGAAVVTYALLKRRVLDFGFVLNRAVVVSIVGLIVVIAFVLLEWVLGSVLTGVSHATSLIANAALALVIGVSLNYVHKRVDHSVDLVLFRKRHEDEQSLLAFSKEAAYITEWDALIDATLEKVRRHTDAGSASALIGANGFYSAVRAFGDNTVASVNENDEAILALKVWHKPIDPHHYDTQLHAALALPMLSRGKLYGVLVLGERAGGEAYAPDEVDALSQLANGVGSALEALSLTAGSSATAMADYVAELHDAIASVGERLAEMHSEIRALRSSSLT